MGKRICVSAVALFAVVLVCAPAWAQQGNSNSTPLFTYVALWGVPRAQWSEVAKVNADDKPILDPLVANGTLLGYGEFENRVHSDGGYTHGSWFQATSLANIFKALEALYSRPGVTSPVLAASKHMDYLMISTNYGGRAVTNATGYLRVISVQVQPGKMDEFVAAFRQYLVPFYEKLLAAGTIVNYQLDSEYNIENAPGRVFIAVAIRDAEGLDKIRIAAAEMFEKNPAVYDALVSATVPNSRNDLLARITSMTRK